MVRVADNKLQGVHTFYVESTSGKEYVVQYIRRGHKRSYFCSCPDFLFRQLPLGRLCKHAKAIKLLVKEYHGVRRLVKVARRRNDVVIPADAAIHHINGNIHDNRPENLKVVNIRENRVSA